MCVSKLPVSVYYTYIYTYNCKKQGLTGNNKRRRQPQYVRTDSIDRYYILAGQLCSQLPIAKYIAITIRSKEIRIRVSVHMHIWSSSIALQLMLNYIYLHYTSPAWYYYYCFSLHKQFLAGQSQYIFSEMLTEMQGSFILLFTYVHIRVYICTCKAIGSPG